MKDNDHKTTPTLLIADDDSQVRMALRVRLESQGYEVLECENGIGAIGLIRARHVDALVLDHQMPLGEGRIVASRIRDLTDSPIIFLSGHSREDFRESVLRIPNTYYLPKPLDGERLTELLRSLISTPCAVAN